MVQRSGVCTADSGTFGDSRRNSLNGPGLTNVNFSLGKSFAIWEQVHLQIRADASNLLNHPSFALPGSALTVCSLDKNGNLPSGCSAVGAVAAGSSTIRGETIGGRHMQLGARFDLLINSVGMAGTLRHPRRLLTDDLLERSNGLAMKLFSLLLLIEPGWSRLRSSAVCGCFYSKTSSDSRTKGP